MFPILKTYKNLLLHASLSISLTLLLTFLKIPVFFLYALHTYIHPDNLSSSGVRAAIRRPDGGAGSDSASKPTSNPELRRRTKSKENKFEFDENNAQIFRLKLDDAHLQSRLYFHEYRNAFTLSSVAISSLLLQKYLNRGSEASGSFADGGFVPVLLGFVVVSKLLALLAKVSFEKSASRRSEKQMSVLFGVLGAVVGNMVCFTFSPSVLDFNFGPIDGFGRFSIAVLMGCIAGFLFMPASKCARAFWIGTDQPRSNLAMISCGWFSRLILYANYLVTVVTAVLWINPLSGMLVCKNTDDGKGGHLVQNVGNLQRLYGNVGILPSDFAKLRIWCLLFSGFLQLVALRPNLQMYLNEALLSWYQRLHASKIPDLEFSRAKVFLHNHFLCLVVLQFFAPPVLLLVFLGLSQVDGNSIQDYQLVCSLLPCSAFVKEVALFLAWWVVFVWAVYTSVILVLLRRGNLYVS